MLIIASSVGTLLALSMLLSIVTFIAGCAVGACLFRSSHQAKVAPAPKDVAQAHAVERAMMASSRIRDLMSNALSHVGEHGAHVDSFSSSLQAIANQVGEVSTDTLILAIGQMTCANSELKERLARIESQMASQANELKVYGSEARTDALTGLANRRAFDDELQRRYAEWQRRRTPFSLMILDIDNFKQINDSHGHQAGDEVLRKIATIINTNSRQMDFRSRYGGDEFILVLPDATIAETRAAAERVRAGIEAAKISFGDARLVATCSIGVARVNPTDDIARLIRRADEGLYKAKEAGRNCGYYHDGKVCVPLDECGADTRANDSISLVESLADRQAFANALDRRLPESQRFGIPLSIIHLSVANYPAICAKYGDATARKLLGAVVSFTQHALRQIDVLARLDDGEFVVLLPGSTRNEANLIARRLQVSAANCDARLANERVTIALRHGIAEFRPNDSADLIMGRAKSEAHAQPASQPVEA